MARYCKGKTNKGRAIKAIEYLLKVRYSEEPEFDINRHCPLCKIFVKMDSV